MAGIPDERHGCEKEILRQNAAMARRKSLVSPKEKKPLPKTRMSRMAKRKSIDRSPDAMNGKVKTVLAPTAPLSIDHELSDTTLDDGDIGHHDMHGSGEKQMGGVPASNDTTIVSDPKTSTGETKSYAAVVSEGGVDGNREDDRKTESTVKEGDLPYPQLPTLAEIESREQQAWRAAGIRFAPVRVPMTRRLQTAAVLFHCLTIGLFVSCFWLICANPLTWPILVPYLIHLTMSTAATNGKLNYRSEWMRSLRMWKLFAGYFPARLHKTYDLDPKRKYIFGYHPHGIISHGAWAAFATNALGFAEKFPGITNTLLTLDSNFRLPFNRDWILAMGLQSVSKESIWNILTKGGSNGEGQGRAVTIVVGGARESLEAQPGTLRLILKGRKGFVKMALRTGADLVPVVAFGENDLYDQLSPKTHPLVHKIQMFFLKVFKFTLPALHGRGVLNYDVGLMPYRRPVNIVVGKPIRIDTPRDSQPAQEDIDKYHELYVQEVERLWEAYKDQFSATRSSEMQIIA